MTWTKWHTIGVIVVLAVVVGIIMARKKRKNKDSDTGITFVGADEKQAHFIINGEKKSYVYDQEPLIVKQGDSVVTIKRSYGDNEEPLNQLEILTNSKKIIPLKNVA